MCRTITSRLMPIPLSGIVVILFKLILFNMKWINDGDIKYWLSHSTQCSRILPELICRLIWATADVGDIKRIIFPSGDGVAQGGWDGTLDTSAASPFFPIGISGWEIGMEESCQVKANKDYAKRTADPMGLTRSETTFVFVTPRPFAKFQEWQNQNKSTSIWKDVRVIAGAELLQWINECPAVASWLAGQIGILPSGVRDIGRFWEEWSVVTNPTVTPELIIAGRLKDEEYIRSWIEEKPSVIEVRGDSADEPLAFLHSVIARSPENQRIRSLSRCIKVENIEQFRSVSEYKSPLIIVAPASCREAASYAVQKGHHVFLGAEAKSIRARGRFTELSRPQRTAIEQALSKINLSGIDAQRIARDFGKSMVIFRRHQSIVGADKPAWAEGETAKSLLPVLFVGAWDDKKEEDRKVVEVLAGINYGDFIKNLTPLLAMDDSPILKVGDVWKLKSPLDAWFLLSSSITGDFLKLFRSAATSVFTKDDPKYDLPENEQWMAALYNKTRPHSEWLRIGMAESLVLLALGDISTQSFVDDVVKEILDHQSKWEDWASIKDIMPILAEASLDQFMGSVEQTIKNNPQAFQSLMGDANDCNHSGLLWALESLAWSPEYFTRAVNILCELSSLDPGGQYANRPINSLGDIFLPGMPQTNATSKQRLDILDILKDKYPHIVWQFARRYYNGGVISETHRFRWRDLGGDRRGLETEDNDEHRKYISGLFPIMIDLACKKENLISAIDDFTQLPAGTGERVLMTLENMDLTILSKNEKDELLIKIREALHWINTYGEDQRLAQVPNLERVMDKFQSEDVIERMGWIVSNPWPKLPQGTPKNYDDQGKVIKAAQKDAAREILDKATLEQIINFAKGIQYPGNLGYLFGIVVKSTDEDNAILDSMVKHAKDIPDLISGYSMARVEIAGHDWIDKQISRLKTESTYTPEVCALLYLSLPAGKDTWLAIGNHGKEAEKEYWTRASGYSRITQTEDAAIAIEKLIEAKRPEIALQIAGNPSISSSSGLLSRLLRELLAIDENKIKGGAMDYYYLGHIFEQLYKQEELPLEEIANLEWPFVTVFDEIERYTSTPMAIHRILQKDTSLFAELVALIYKRDDHKEVESAGAGHEKAEIRWRIARDVLRSWNLLPGLKGRDIDENELNEWIDSARKKCAETNHTIGGDLQIGFMLAHAPNDSDGVWPHVAVRDVIEHLNNDTIDEHIAVNIRNSRGVVSRGLTDGGKQERELSSNYRKMFDALKTKWPRTAAILKSLAESYEHQAKHEDIDSDLNELRWD